MTARNQAWNIDPSAGVRLMPLVRECPRCGIVKSGGTSARRGLCQDCSAVLLPAERKVWAA